MRFPKRLLRECLWSCHLLGVPLTNYLLLVESASQTAGLYRQDRRAPRRGVDSSFARLAEYRASTSRFGLGQISGSYRTPAGLHRVAEKHGAGWPIGTSFRGRKPVGSLWGGDPHAPVPHRIFWLEGLAPGVNRGGEVDSYERYIYIHGVADESTLGHAVSAGCIHLSAEDLLPLHDLLPCGAIVWIG